MPSDVYHGLSGTGAPRVGMAVDEPLPPMPERPGHAFADRRNALMAYTIVDTCTKDELCVEACPVDCIHPKKDEEGFEAATQLWVDPNGCIDCGACVPVCPTNSVFPNEEVPADKAEFIEKNAAYYA